jgi:GT2 family glycosyltransferase
LDELKMLLAGFNRQSYQKFELVIADDGSNPLVIAELNVLASRYRFKMIHSWHEDIGWRKNKALNQAVQKSNGDYLIFCDGDCIPHRHFVREHVRSAGRNRLLGGRRVRLSEEIGKILSEAFVSRGGLENFFWLKRHRATHVENAIRLPHWLIGPYWKLQENRKGILGSNFSLYKDAFLNVNGFDERYAGPYYGEDTDIEYRLRLAGLRVRSIKHLAVQYHIYHPKSSKSKIETNRELFNETRKRNQYRTDFGMIRRSEIGKD